MAATAVAANAQGTAHLSGTIKGLDGGNAIVMQYGEDYRESDTQQVKPDGTFSADINVRQPNVAYLIVDKYKVSRLLFLEQARGQVTVPQNRPGDRSLSRRNIQKYNLKCYKK